MHLMDQKLPEELQKKGLLKGMAKAYFGELILAFKMEIFVIIICIQST